MNIKLLTSSFGGPYKWGVDLAVGLRHGGIRVAHVHNRYYMLVNILQQFSVDIVHSTIPIPARLWQKPLVVTIKGDYTIEQNIWQRFYPRLVEQADIVTTPSNFIKEKIGVSDAIVIPNAIRPEECQTVVHVEKKRLDVATIMNFYFQGKARGFVTLAEMLDKSDLPEFRHIIVGNGPFCEEAIAATKVMGRDFLFSGLLNDPRMVLAHSDLFLYYSYHDNFPNVILEAMAHGLPVVTNNIGAVSEIIENGVDGYVAGNDDEYIEILRKLTLDVDLRQRIGRAARKSVDEKFNWGTIVNQYIEVYRKLCQKLKV